MGVRRNNFLHTLFVVLCGIFILFTSCAPLPPSYTPAPFMLESELSTLNQFQLFTRVRWATGECLRTADSYTQLKALRTAKAVLDDCDRVRQSDELKRLTAFVADLHPEWPKNLRSALKAGLPFAIGMTDSQMRALMGEPDKINTSVFPRRVSQQWVYRGSYFYFDDGTLTSYQLNQ